MEVDKTFWKRLQSFVAKVQVTDAMLEEERGYILHVAAEQASGGRHIIQYCGKCGKELRSGLGCTNHLCVVNTNPGEFKN